MARRFSGRLAFVDTLTGFSCGTPRRACRLAFIPQLAQASDGAGMHDLLGDYARDLASMRDDDLARRAALRRLADCYQHTAAMEVEMLLYDAD